MQVRPIKNFYYDNEVLPDRLISHMALVFSSLAHGGARIKNVLLSADTVETIKALKEIGVELEIIGKDVVVPEKLSLIDKEITINSSRVSFGILCGALAGRFYNFTINAGPGLKDINFSRVLTPLMIMGANITSNDGKLPVTINPASLKGMRYDMINNDSVVKAAILAAGLNAGGEVILNKMYDIKNHAEIMLKFLGADIDIAGKRVSMNTKGLPQDVYAKDIYVPGDMTMAAYVMGLGILCGKKGIRIKNVGLNPTRFAVLEALNAFGARLKIDANQSSNGEPYGDVIVAAGEIVGTTFTKENLALFTDEFPLLMAMACFAKGETVFEGVNDHFYRENPAYIKMQESLLAMGADITANDNEIRIFGKTEIAGGVSVDCGGDYRVAMGLAVCGARSKDGCYINDFDCVKEIYPDFKEILI